MTQTEVESNNIIATANVMTVGTPVMGSISANGDQDWYAFYLTAGTPYQFDLVGSMTGGGTLTDPFLELFNASGTPIASDDDGASLYDASSGHITNSQIVFIPNESGTYYLVANGFDNVLGSYQLTSHTLNTDYYIRSVLNDPVASWNGGQAAASPVTVTFSFPTTLPIGFLAGDSAGFAAFSETQKAATRHALQDIAELTHIDFVEVANGAGQIRFATTDQLSSGGVTYWDSSDMLLTSADIALDNSTSTNSNVSSGSYGYMALVHEIGHALGLKHPGDYNAGGGGTLPPYLPTSQDASPYTIESYNFTTAYLDLSSNAYKYVKTMMTFDVAALQMVYGVNTDTRSDNNSYAFDVAAMYTIWDGGGTDTLDASTWATAGVSINLNAGALSYSGLLGTDTLDTKLAPCVAIAFDCVIENAIGTSKDDIILGNAADNVLRGGLGDDRIEGGFGNDFLDGGEGNNTLIGDLGVDRFSLLLGATNTIMDFTSGLDGDSIYLTDLLASLNQFSTGDNPFATGYLKFIQRGADTQLWVDADGTGSFQSLVNAAVLKNIDASRIIAANVNGFIPDTAATGGITISGTASEDLTITTVSTLADIDGMGVLRYQWQSSLNGTMWVDIETAGDSDLTLGDALVGQHIRVIASYVDGHGVTESVTSNQTGLVTNVNDAPVANAGSTTTAEDTAKIGKLTGSDIDGDTFTFTKVADPAHGAVTIDSTTGAYTYKPEANYNGSDSFTFKVNDGIVDSITATVNLTITPVNDAPSGSVTISGTLAVGGVLSVTDAFTDADGIPSNDSGAFVQQWFADGVAIAQAIDSAFTLTKEQAGKSITVAVSYTDSDGTPESVTSIAVDVPAGKELDLMAYHWRSHILLSDVLVSNGALTHATSTNGATTFEAINDPTVTLTVTRPVPATEAADTNDAVDLQDAIAILKMIVGLDVNGAGKPLSLYQSLAADYDGNGVVALTDAIGVLKHVVGLPSPDPTWHFVSESDPAVAANTSLNPRVPTGIAVDMGTTSPVHMGLVGYLSGDVDGSYAGGASALDLDSIRSDYFQNLHTATGLSLSQFGIYAP